MLKYKNILLATDLSDNSHKVAERAHEIAKESNAKLNVIHVIEHSPVAYGGEFAIPIDVSLEKTIEENAKQALVKLGEEFNINTADQHLESGSVKLAVINCAEEISCDLIVVGTHGHHGIELLLGSRANAILHAAKCDVLIVRIQEK